MANQQNTLKLLLLVSILYVCIGFTSTRSSSIHPIKKGANDAEEVEAEVPEVPEAAGEVSDDGEGLPSGRLSPKRRPNGCPFCDSSVYSYCSDKLLHDACCCLDPQDTDLPNECQFADCSFLHSNTCREHRLITACCCNQFLSHKK